MTRVVLSIGSNIGDRLARLQSVVDRLRDAVRAISPVFSTYNRRDSAAARGESSHAEAFYFQKQIQSRTLMIFLLEDGERIEGTVEWYDRNAIKVKQGAVRTLIYKASIKYLYKATDINQVNAQP